MGKLHVVNNYGVTPNEVLNDPNLTLKAKGLFGYIQSKPEGWQFSAEKIQSQCTDGRDSIRAGLKELEDAGLLVRNKYQDEKGCWQYQYVLRLPNVGKPAFGSPNVGEPGGISKKDKVKKSSNKDIDILPYPGKSTPLSRLRKFYTLLYRNEYDIEPKVYLNGKDGAVLKSLLKDYTEYQIAAILIEHFSSSDWKLKEAAFPITWISPRVNQYVTEINSDINFSDSKEIREYVDHYVKQHA